MEIEMNIQKVWMFTFRAPNDDEWQEHPCNDGKEYGRNHWHSNDVRGWCHDNKIARPDYGLDYAGLKWKIWFANEMEAKLFEITWQDHKTPAEELKNMYYKDKFIMRGTSQEIRNMIDTEILISKTPAEDE